MLKTLFSICLCSRLSLSLHQHYGQNTFNRLWQETHGYRGDRPAADYRQRFDYRRFVATHRVPHAIHAARGGRAGGRGAAAADEQRAVGEHALHHPLCQPVQETVPAGACRVFRRAVHLGAGSSGHARRRSAQDGPPQQGACRRDKRYDYPQRLFGK